MVLNWTSLLEDLARARLAHARNVLQVRRDNPNTIARTGNEWFKRPDGSLAALITRPDFRADTETFVLEQTSDQARDPRRRPLEDPFNLVLGDYVRHFKKWHEGSEAQLSICSVF